MVFKLTHMGAVYAWHIWDTEWQRIPPPKQNGYACIMQISFLHKLEEEKKCSV